MKVVHGIGRWYLYAIVVVIAVSSLVIFVQHRQQTAITTRRACYFRVFHSVLKLQNNRATATAARACGEKDPTPTEPTPPAG
jgi:surface polysaccharide O-acyltransferase-like enzyme